MIAEPCARWTDDCQGKKDYDGRLLSISSRYWPGNYSSDGNPSAVAAITINHGEPDEYGYAESTDWRREEFSAPTEAEVKTLVEEWVRTQMAAVLALLGA